LVSGACGITKARGKKGEQCKIFSQVAIKAKASAPSLTCVLRYLMAMCDKHYQAILARITALESKLDATLEAKLETILESKVAEAVKSKLASQMDETKTVKRKRDASTSTSTSASAAGSAGALASASTDVTKTKKKKSAPKAIALPSRASDAKKEIVKLRRCLTECIWCEESRCDCKCETCGYGSKAHHCRYYDVVCVGDKDYDVTVDQTAFWWSECRLKRFDKHRQVMENHEAGGNQYDWTTVRAVENSISAAAAAAGEDHLMCSVIAAAASSKSQSAAAATASSKSPSASTAVASSKSQSASAPAASSKSPSASAAAASSKSQSASAPAASSKSESASAAVASSKSESASAAVAPSKSRLVSAAAASSKSQSASAAAASAGEAYIPCSEKESGIVRIRKSSAKCKCPCRNAFDCRCDCSLCGTPQEWFLAEFNDGTECFVPACRLDAHRYVIKSGSKRCEWVAYDS
jgi:hypothetical protein